MIKQYKSYSLKNHNTFGIDVIADDFVEYSTTKDLIYFLKQKKLERKKILNIGFGSNLLFVSDYKGTILHSKILGLFLEEETDNEVIVSAGAGVVWDDFVVWCIKNELGGIENLSNIPGTVGAAPIQNIGAYGVELKDVFYKIEGVLVENCENLSFYLKDCDFGYRHSIFKGYLKDKVIITKLFLKLKKKLQFNIEYDAIKKELANKNEDLSLEKIRNTIISIRKSKLPDPEIIGNAGSFFKNPIVSQDIFLKLKESYPEVPYFEIEKENFYKIPAGWLIEKSGWKGKHLGRAGVHQQQALVLVNLGGATGQDVLKLSNEIEKDINQKFGIKIEKEVNIIG